MIRARTWNHLHVTLRRRDEDYPIRDRNDIVASNRNESICYKDTPNTENGASRCNTKNTKNTTEYICIKTSLWGCTWALCGRIIPQIDYDMANPSIEKAAYRTLRGFLPGYCTTLWINGRSYRSLVGSKFFHGAKALVSYQSMTIHVTSLAWCLIVMHVVDFSALWECILIDYVGWD